ncbi:hypothetical protein [Pseudoroseicyclus aestuarii]|uniref:DUF1036 domain-containing protein n=1 Tax=Pseudoroseicyclus aestuarii TaxID=1795041 RepID=A0A318T0I1_9RHOB|nr:hypothetical protein [Pseudoroseicyclus aestuarii]PYE83674.1 hypothetical protein DFP88_10332 [Pseudoroseicyclus aestuarii]
MRALIAALTLAAAPAQAERLHFCWVGEAGFTMTGSMVVPDDRLDGGIVTEEDVTAFAIVGYRDGRQVGKWSLREMEPETSWVLTFDSEAMEFVMPGTSESQAWNANGAVNDCGNPGFGFNAGNGGQDVCVDGVFEYDSTIEPTTPLPASRAAVDPLCCGRELIG